MRANTKIAAAVAIILLSSCHTAKKATIARVQKNPRFINDMTIGGKGSNKIQMRVIEGRHNKREEDGTVIITKKERKQLQDKYADKVGVHDKTIRNLALYIFINDWYGTRYRLGGNDRDGIDCSAFAQKLYADVFGIDLVRTSYEQFTQCRRIKKKEHLREGNLVFFGKDHVTHVGVYLANGHFVHASTSEGVTISSLDEPYWLNNYYGGGEIAGEED
jgi:cell wall-associated NlpC family hydrolase